MVSSSPVPDNLARAQPSVDRCPGSAEALTASAGAHDLLLLDDGSADGSGLLLCQELRAGDSTVPLLVIGDRAGTVDAAVATTFGASDYLAKPFRLGALLSRIQAQLAAAPRRCLDTALQRRLPAGHDAGGRPLGVAFHPA